MLLWLTDKTGTVSPLFVLIEIEQSISSQPGIDYLSLSATYVHTTTVIGNAL